MSDILTGFNMQGNDPIDDRIVSKSNLETLEQYLNRVPVQKRYYGLTFFALDKNNELRKYTFQTSLIEPTIDDDEEEIERIDKELQEHVSDKAIHKTSEEIRSEIVDADIPDTIARVQWTLDQINTAVINLIGGASDEYNTLKRIQTKIEELRAKIYGDDGGTVLKTLEQALKFLNQYKDFIVDIPENFVSKQDIVDNLTTDDPTKVLSAKQGKVLSDTLTNYFESAMQSIRTETDRAINAENRIETKLDKEIDRSTKEDQRIDSKLDSEINRSTDEDLRIDSKLDAEIERSTNEDIRIDNKLDSEINRSTAEDDRLDKKIDAETTRATDAESNLNTKIETETDRAEREESRIETKLDNEIARSTNKDIEHDNRLTALEGDTHEQNTDLGTTNSTFQLKYNTGNKIKHESDAISVRNAADTDYVNFIAKNATFKGDLLVEGQSFVTEAETVEIKDNLLLLNKGEVGAGVTKGIAGLEIDRGTEPNYQIIFDESDNRFKAGEIGDIQCLALRDGDNSMVNGMFTSWDSSTKRLKTTNIVPSDQKLSFGDNGDIELKYSLSKMGEIFSSAIPILNIGRKSSGYPHIEFGLSSNQAVVYTDALNGIYLQNQVLGRTFKRATDLSEVLYHADIVNNLTSGGTNKVLSAEQGKLLQNSITSIQGSYLPLIGGTLTGQLTIKQSVDIKLRLQSTDADNHCIIQAINSQASQLGVFGYAGDKWAIGHNGTYYEIWDKYNLTNPVTYTTNTYNHATLTNKDGQYFTYIKAGTNGLLPHSKATLASGGSGSLGTSDQSFNTAYINHLHANRITFGETGPYITGSTSAIQFLNAEGGVQKVATGGLYVGPSYDSDALSLVPSNGIYSRGIIYIENGIGFRNSIWTNDLTPNRNYSGYLQVLDAYDASSDGGPTNYGTVLQINSRIDHWANQLWFGNNDAMYLRRMNYGSTTYGEWIKLATTSDLGSYLPLSGGTISSSKSNPLTINSTHASQSSIDFSRGGVNKGTVGFYESLGSFLQNVTGEILAVKSDGAYYGVNIDSLRKLVTVTDLNNYLPLTGGALSGTLTINTIGTSTFAVNNSDTNGVETYIKVLRKGTLSAAIGFMDSLGAYIYNYNSNKYLFIDNNGDARVGTTSGSTRLALITDIPTVSGYLPLTGGTLTGTLSINSGGSEPLIINNSASAGEAYVVTKTQGTTRGVMGWNSSLGMFLQDNRGYTFSMKADGVYFGASSSTLTKLPTSTDLSGYLPLAGGTMTGALTMSSRRHNIVVDVVGGAGNSWDEGAGALSIQVPNDSGQTPLILARRSGAAIGTTVAKERLLSMELLDNGHSFIIGMSGSKALQLDWTSGRAGTGKLFGKQIATTDRIPSIPSISISNSGSGNAVTSITASGHTLTVTKGATYLTSHQTIYNLTFQAGTFTAKTFDPNGAAATVNIPTKTSHITNDSGFITSSALNGYATQSWANSQFAPLKNYFVTSNCASIATTGNEMCIGSLTSGNSIINVNYRNGTGTTSPSTWYWRAGSSTSWANAYWGNLYMNNNLVATQTWSNSQYPLKTGTGASGTWDINISGNASTASAASKLGSTTIGGSAKPIYLSSGTPTACSATVGSATVPVHMNAGTITQCSTTLGVSITGNAATATNASQLGGTAAASYVKANDNISRLTNDSGYTTQEWVNGQGFLTSDSLLDKFVPTTGGYIRNSDQVLLRIQRTGVSTGTSRTIEMYFDDCNTDGTNTIPRGSIGYNSEVGMFLYSAKSKKFLAMEYTGRPFYGTPENRYYLLGSNTEYHNLDGYQRIGDIMIQWGYFSVQGNSTRAVNFPVSFTNTVWSVTGSWDNTTTGSQENWGFTDYTSSGFTIINGDGSSRVFHYIAIGPFTRS